MKNITRTLLMLSVVSPFCLHAVEVPEERLQAEKILGDIDREARKLGRQLDRVRLETQVQVGSPLLEQWLIKSQQQSAPDSEGIPDAIADQLRGFYPDSVLDAVRFKIGDPGVFNLSRLSIQYGGAQAVTLVDVVVFKNAEDAHNNAGLWAHELHHVEQFREWGVRDFSVRYVRDWYEVEHAAYERQGQYLAWHREKLKQLSSLASPPVADRQRER